jgi:uncharacterized protein YndB with AHSA1/START domain
MAKTKDISLSLVRTIKAPPEKVFAAWTDPKTLKKWMSPTKEMEVAVAETDLRIGGRYRILMREPDGKEHGVAGVYKEIVNPKKLAFTWGWENSTEMNTLVTVELRKKGAGTELTLTHSKFADDKTRDMHNQGWMGCIGRLEVLFAA